MRVVLPPPLAARAAAVAAGDEPAAPIWPASTVVLLRDGPDGLEAYLQRRHRGMAFAAGVYAFPGGRIDGVDAEFPDALWSGPDPKVFAGVFAASARQARAHVVGVVRELFEETDVLLARPGRAGAPAWPTDSDRRALTHGATLADLLAVDNLVLDAAALIPWARWVTPRFEKRRFDAWFFVAALPDGQEPRVTTDEAHDDIWIRPSAALALLTGGEMAMLPPTWWTLRQLAEHAKVSDATAQPPPMVRFTVGWTTDGGDAVMVMPDHPAYPGDDPQEGR